MIEPRFVPVKRTAIDGKVWWEIYDRRFGVLSTQFCHGRHYKKKKDAQFAIDYAHKQYAEYGY